MAFEAYNLLGQKGIKGERNPDPNLSDAEATYLYSRKPGDYNSDNQGLTTTRSGEVVPVDQELHNKKLEDAGVIPLGSLTGVKHIQDYVLMILTIQNLHKVIILLVVLMNQKEKL